MRRAREAHACRGADAVGCVAGRALRVARVKLEAAGIYPSLRQGDMYALPFADGTADNIVIHQVLHYAHAPAAAIGEAGPHDIVLVAGKGHEQGQVVGDLVLPFDDVAVARECAA